MAAGDPSLRLYAILDAETCKRRGVDPVALATAWRNAGVRLLQYRDKISSDADVLRLARGLANAFRTDGSILVLNDRAHLVGELGWDGAHIGQGDGGAAAARAIIGDDAILGLSTHNADEAAAASREDVDYVAVGPVYGTQTKLDASPPVGLCGVQAARAVVTKPLVAIGGVDATKAQDVFQAGANSIAVISALLEEDSGRLLSFCVRQP